MSSPQPPPPLIGCEALSLCPLSNQRPAFAIDLLSNEKSPSPPPPLYLPSLLLIACVELSWRPTSNAQLVTAPMSDEKPSPPPLLRRRRARRVGEGPVGFRV